MSAALRVLFGHRPLWEKALRRSLDDSRYQMRMQPLEQADLAAFDLIVPLMLPDHAFLESAGPGVPALIVPRAMRRLCRDKLALNQRLIDLGLGHHVPRLRDRLPEDLTTHPVVLKARDGSGGVGTRILNQGPPDDEVLTLLADGSHFLQDHVPGAIELATHVLIKDGRVRMMQTMEFDMGPSPYVKGVGQKPRRARWLEQTPGRADLVNILRNIGFDHGTCCFDYRMQRGHPVIFEINPRFGRSLSERVTPYLDSLLTCLAE